ncbi:uncharacterized protein LOC100844950 isoform X2 [Brachypodium distachyon]|uniref:MBD domain-containing protein n=1 Tax=Brachypodium distachyon TaxID=15368 RepID=A0A0Q3E717_BRADI|nr:uncharacterized protein LOC100844950 isoform X2 [Brachypodium distachyon]KQJ82068.1 hypothetical protein BRADI_5g05225v3 [Brachypodium distachyon]|eukprot:XP_014751665.1 uncharacterized protein LOC100844950 isoform X2 [Brachypodium distachyon]
MPTSESAVPSCSVPRRSARALARRQLPDETPSPASVAPPATAAGPSSLPSRRRRGAVPSQRSVSVRKMDDFQPLVAVPDDKDVNQLDEAGEWKKESKEVGEAEGLDEEDENVAALKEAPFWFPDGWIINVHHGDGGSTHRYYTSPVSEYTFSTNMEALHYLFSEMDEFVLESQACAVDNKLLGMYRWLPDGWVIEVRAGGKVMDKMYKILAQVEFNPDGLPNGWVKEVIFRKCNDGIRKDPYYTDPISHLVFRTLKSVTNYLETGEISKHAYIPRRSVMDMYSFDHYTDLPQRFLKRLQVQGKAKRKSTNPLVFEKELPDVQTSNLSQGDTFASLNPLSGPKGKFETVMPTGKELIGSQTVKRPRGRPPKISKPINETTSDCPNSSHQDRTHIMVKRELGTKSGEQMLKENTLEYNEIEMHAVVTEEVDKKSDLAGCISLRREKPGLVTYRDLYEQDNVNSAKASGKSASSSVHKFYMRRNSNRTMILKQE